jgi:TonB family protein
MFAIFSHVHLKVDKPEHNVDLVINFIEPKKDIQEEKEEEIIKPKDNFLKEFEDPTTNQASSRSNEKSVEDLRKSMKSLKGARNEKTDLFSDEATRRNIKTQSTKSKESTDGRGEAERIEENAFTGKSTINYYLKGRYNDKLPNPIYTCIKGGFIYIDIKVNQQGRVIDASFNRSKSKTSNECLKETALKYARKARFNSDFRAKEIQKGYITYDFHKN